MATTRIFTNGRMPRPRRVIVVIWQKAGGFVRQMNDYMPSSPKPLQDDMIENLSPQPKVDNVVGLSYGFTCSNCGREFRLVCDHCDNCKQEEQV